MKVKLGGSFRRYFVSMKACERHPDPLKQGLENALEEGRFRGIDGSEGQVRAVGWCAAGGLVPDPFVDVALRSGRALILWMRVDQKRIPAGAVGVRQLALESRERREVGERIAPSRRREIRDSIESELLARCVPATTVYQVLWDTASGRLLFSATSDAANGAFRSLFRETFGRVAQPVTASSSAARASLSLGRERALDGILPVSFQP